MSRRELIERIEALQDRIEEAARKKITPRKPIRIRTEPRIWAFAYGRVAPGKGFELDASDYWSPGDTVDDVVDRVGKTGVSSGDVIKLVHDRKIKWYTKQGRRMVMFGGPPGGFQVAARQRNFIS